MLIDSLLCVCVKILLRTYAQKDFDAHRQIHTLLFAVDGAAAVVNAAALRILLNLN